MRRCCLLIIFALLLCSAHSPLRAGAYTLTDGQTLVGEPISYNESGLIVRTPDGEVSSRIPWDQFSQDALKQLLEEAKTPRDKAFVEPLIEETIQRETKRREIEIKPVPKPSQPTGSVGILAGFSSPVFLLIFIVIYLANLYAAYEIAFYKNSAPGLVVGVSAIAPFLGPILFLCLPGKADPMHGELYGGAKTSPPAETPAGEPAVATPPVPGDTTAATPLVAPASPLVAPAGAPVASGLRIAHAPVAQPDEAQNTLPEPIVYNRGDFTFNRRFVETKLAGFLRVVPNEEDKDLVLAVKSARGDFLTRHISRLTQNEMVLQALRGDATHEEPIPFTEIQQITVQHKDA